MEIEKAVVPGSLNYAQIHSSLSIEKLRTIFREPSSTCARNYKYQPKNPQQSKSSGPSSYDRPDMRTTWVTTKILVLTYDHSLELRPELRSRPKRVSACAVVNKDPRCVRKRQSEPRYACLWA
jgi:hypothetical protein